MNKSHISHVFFILMSSALVIVFPKISYADACDDINILAGYGVIGEGSFDYGNNSEINANDITGNGNTPTPSGTTETVDLDFPDIDPSIFPATGGADLDPPSPPSVAAGSYGTIEFVRRNNNPTLTFTGGDYFITELILKNGATVEFAPGNYFIETISFDNNSELVISPSGPVSIYLKNSFQAGSQSEINSTGNTGDLVFYLYDAVTFEVGNGDNSDATKDFNGIIYSPNSNTTIDFGNNNTISGAIFSAGSVEVGTNTNFDYSPSVQEEVIEALGCTPVVAGPDHYAISHGGIGVTCEAETVTISAHDASHLPVAPSSTTTITVSTSIVNDGWSLKSGNGVFDGSDRYTFDGVESAVEFWLRKTAATTAPHMDIDVFDGSASDDAGEDPVLEFRDSALRFYANGVHNTIGTQIAGKSSAIVPGNQILTLSAVQANSDTGACEARITGTHTVQMAYDCVNPVNCKNHNGVDITDNTLAVATTIPDTLPGANVDLVFDASGTAAWSLKYADAGKISLSAILNIAAVGNDPADTLNGTSNDFVSKPAGLCVTVPDVDADCPSPPPTDYFNCSRFKKAGETFNLRVEAVGWQGAGETNTDFCAGNAVTPNFALANIGIGQTLVAPATATTGTLGVTSLDMLLSDDGTHTENNQTVSEVGVFTFTATAPDYLDPGVTIAPSTSATVGRFYPDHFILSGQQLIDRSDLLCASAFTYMDENFQVSYSLTAIRLGGTSVADRTRNYTGNFARLDLPAELNYGAVDITGPTELTARLNTSPVFAVSDGVIDITDTVTFNRLLAPDGPYTVSVGIAPVDDDGIQLQAYNLDVVAGGGNDHALIDTTGIRFGRLVVANAFGSELQPLNIAIKAQSYDTSTASFSVNSNDLCSPYNVSNIDLSVATYTAPLTAAQLGLTGAGVVVSGTAQFSMHDDASSVAGPGVTGEVLYKMTVPPYLQFDWDGDAVFTDNPSAKATFGIFSGDSRQIYFRQIFQP